MGFAIKIWNRSGVKYLLEHLHCDTETIPHMLSYVRRFDQISDAEIYLHRICSKSPWGKNITRFSKYDVCDETEAQEWFKLYIEKCQEGERF